MNFNHFFPSTLYSPIIGPMSLQGLLLTLSRSIWKSFYQATIDNLCIFQDKKKYLVLSQCKYVFEELDNVTKHIVFKNTWTVAETFLPLSNHSISKFYSPLSKKYYKWIKNITFYNLFSPSVFSHCPKQYTCHKNT